MRQPESPSGGYGSPQAPSFPVVCLLASAGGLEPLEAFFRQVPEGTPMAFLVLQHLPPDQPCPLPELIERHSALPVSLAKALDPVTEGRVLVLESGMTVDVLEGQLRVAREKTSPVFRAHRLPGDLLMASAAEWAGSRTIGVVLSGTGADGTAGLKAIQDMGGQTLAQSPSTALHGEMPAHAISAGVVDWILPPGQMQARILGHDARPEVPNPHEPSASAALQSICAILARQTGHDFSRYKPGTLHRRVQRRVRITGSFSLQDYLVHLEGSAEEAGALLRELLIGVTEFFRDPEAFEGLTSFLRQELSETGAGEGPLRIWVPGCASGEEAYSIAMLAREQLDALGSPRRVQIFATDIDTAALLMARTGRYSEEALRNVSPERKARFFNEEGASFRVVKELRDMCVFSIQNILRDPPFSSLHLISCRNVFIYLQVPLQRKLVPLFHFALNPRGLLFLGSSEGLASHVDLFDPLDKACRIFRRREVHPTPGLEFPAGGRRLPLKPAVLEPRESSGASSSSPAGLFERMLLEDYVPASAIINEAGNILYCAGRIGRFLQPALGIPTNNLFQSLGGALRRSVRNLVNVAARDHRATQALVLQDESHGTQTLRVTVRPMPGLERDSGVFALVIQEDRSPEHEGTPQPDTASDGPLLEWLDEELRVTRVELQSTVEELESTNEELRSSNEELQSSNEELQTSQEELQSVNQELASINVELHQKIRELNVANSDLQNLLTSTEIATIFLDLDLLITRFTPTATEIFGLINTDVGRPIQDLVPRFSGIDLPAMAREILATGETMEKHVQSLDGHRWFLVRLLPYRALPKEVRGVVATFVDFTEIREAQRVVAESEARFRRLFTNMVEGFAHCRMKFENGIPVDFQYLSVNDAFRTQTGLKDVAGKWVSDVIPGIRDADPGLFEIYGRVASTGVPERFETFVQSLGDWYELQVYCPTHGEFVAVFEVITGRKRLEEERLDLERQLLHGQKLESLGVLAGGIAHDFNNLLQAILANLDVALHVADPDSPSRKPMEQAKQASLRATDLTRQMLAYSGRGVFSIKPVDLNLLLEENHSLLRASIPRTLAFRLDLEPDLPPILADAGQVQQVIMNLITNAAEAVPSSGTIALSTRVGPYDEEALTRSRLLEKPGPGLYTCVEVTDDGCGMDEETQNRLFDPFFTTKTTGRGLGMSAILGIVRGHGGAIFVDSCPGTGTSIRVLFPAAKDASPPSGPAPAQGLPAPMKAGTLLLVDDEPMVLESNALMLRQLGFQVLCAASGEEALEQFKASKDGIGGVLLDLSMPGMDGMDTIKGLRGVRPDIPVLLTSGYAEQEIQNRMQAFEHLQFLQKPYDFKTLAERVRLAFGPQPLAT